MVDSSKRINGLRELQHGLRFCIRNIEMRQGDIDFLGLMLMLAIGVAVTHAIDVENGYRKCMEDCDANRLP